MPAPYIEQDVQIFYSKAAQSAINTPVKDTVDGALYGAALVTVFPPYIPNPDMVDDADQVGDGSEFPRFVRLYRWGCAFSIGMRLNTELAAVLIKRAFGGTVTNTVVTASTVWDHTFGMQTRAQGRIPQATTFILPNTGGADFWFADMFVNSFTVSQSGDAQPVATFNLMGTGMHGRLSTEGTPLVVPSTWPTHHYFHGAALSLSLNDGSPVDLAASGRIDSYQFDYNNNIIIPRRPGDSFITSGNVASGSYAKNAIHGRRTSSIQFKATLDDVLAEYGWLKNNTLLTSVKIVNVGDIIETSNKWELELKHPTAQLSGASGSSNNSFLTIDDNIMALKDVSTLGLATSRVRNGVATLT